MRVLLVGGTGFIGRAVADHFKKRGDQVVILSRRGGDRFWDPAIRAIESCVLEDVDLVINLAGESVFGRWTNQKMERIKKSRIDSTRFLVDEILKRNKRPQFYIGASAIGFYGDQGESIVREGSLPGNDFLSQVCKEWEAESQRLAEAGIKVCWARFGIVLDPAGGALQKMMSAFRMGLGGKLGNGRQYTSWISLNDLVRAMSFIVERELVGPVNVVAPDPVTNGELTRILGKVLRRPTFVALPIFLLKLLFGKGALIYLESIHALPQRLLEARFHFEDPSLYKFLDNKSLT